MTYDVRHRSTSTSNEARQVRVQPQTKTPIASSTVSSAQKWGIVGVMVCGSTLAMLSSSIIGVAMPLILVEFTVSIDTLTWIAVAYTIAIIITASMSGWLSMLLGRKHLYILSLLVYMSGSLWCGMARSFEFMLVGRIIQGLGAGTLAPVAYAILFSMLTEEKERSTVLSLYLIGPMSTSGWGPVFGGWLTETLDWPWIFFITAPLAGGSALLAARVLPESVQDKRNLVRVDVGGLVLLIVSLTALQILLLRGPREGWFESSFIFAVSLIALGSLLLLVWWEWRIDEPILNLRVLTHVGYSSGVCLALLWGIVFFGSPFLLPLYLQKLRGFSVLNSGLIILPQALATIVFLPLVGRLYAYIDNRLLVGIGMMVLIIGYFDMSYFTLEMSALRMFPSISLMGAGLAFLYTPLTTATISTVPDTLIGAATSIFTLVRRIGGNVGYALVVTQMIQRTAIHRANLSEYTTPGAVGLRHSLNSLTSYLTHEGLSPQMAQYHAQQLIKQTLNRQTTMLAFSDIFIILAFFFLCGVPLLLLMGRRT